ncbi:MAG: NUDIX hydrolase [Pseudomonadota bacterium]|nr:NUDIX hydrolase [Pseudomonadota bacterium]
MRTKPDYYYDQSAVIPYRMRDGHIQVLAVTSRRGKRWVIPKGVREQAMTPAASAAKEAREEAGIEGEVASTALGRYQYDKWGGTCTVEVYPLRVTHELESWEEEFRRREWVSLETAIERMREPGLREILQMLPAFIAPA